MNHVLLIYNLYSAAADKNSKTLHPISAIYITERTQSKNLSVPLKFRRHLKSKPTLHTFHLTGSSLHLSACDELKSLQTSSKTSRGKQTKRSLTASEGQSWKQNLKLS